MDKKEQAQIGHKYSGLETRIAVGSGGGVLFWFSELDFGPGLDQFFARQMPGFGFHA